jgi:hypothetical protein
MEERIERRRQSKSTKKSRRKSRRKSPLKVFVQIDDKFYRKILKPNEYKSKNGEITLPENHYSKGYIERIIDGIDCNKSPEYKSRTNPKPKSRRKSKKRKSQRKSQSKSRKSQRKSQSKSRKSRKSKRTSKTKFQRKSQSKRESRKSKRKSKRTSKTKFQRKSQSKRESRKSPKKSRTKMYAKGDIEKCGKIPFKLKRIKTPKECVKVLTGARKGKHVWVTRGAARAGGYDPYH